MEGWMEEIGGWVDRWESLDGSDMRVLLKLTGNSPANRLGWLIIMRIAGNVPSNLTNIQLFRC